MRKVILIGLLSALALPSFAEETQSPELREAAVTNSAEALTPKIEQLARATPYTPPVKPEKNFTVRDTTVFQQDGRTITFNKVAPPIRQPKPISVQPSPTSEQFAEMQRMAQKGYTNFTFFGTVWDEKITEIEWHYEGVKYQAFVNADMSFLHAMGRFETEESYYSITGMLGHADRDEAEHWIPGRADFSDERAVTYIVVEPDKSQMADEAFKSLEALLSYYGSTKEVLWQKYAERSAKNLARQRYYEANPPSQDVEINFWKKEGGPK